jgi:diguanylate cyclase (GGDEF)-like protein
MRQYAKLTREIWDAATYIGDTNTVLSRAILVNQFQMLKRKIPILHLIILVNSVGLAIAHSFHAPLTLSASLPGAILAICIVRFIRRLDSWGTMDPEDIQEALGQTLINSTLLAIGFGTWGLMLFEYGSRENQAFTAIFIFMSAIGCAYCLGSLPKAARYMIFFSGLPMATRLMLTGDMLLMGMGLNLVFVSILVIRMLGVYFSSIEELIESREAIVDQITRSEVAEARALKTAMTDALTGLANRRALTLSLDRLINDASQGDNTVPVRFGVAMMDLNGFKPINDTYGHAAGDHVLVTVASRLDKLIRDDGLVARLGGDEFAALITTAQTEADCMAYGRRISEAINEPISIGDTTLRISGSCGFALYPVSGANGDLLINRADTALYHCKRNRSVDVAVFQLDLEEHLRRRMKVDQALRSAIENNEIGMAFQPIFDLTTGHLVSFETLARWYHPSIGHVAPDEFIEAAEQSGLITELSSQVLGKSLAAAAMWDSAALISFNISAVQITDPTTALIVLSALNKAGIPPARMIVEITETALLSDLNQAQRTISDLRSAGVRVYIDDFGTGHSALGYLLELEFDMVKVDKSFVQSASKSVESRKLLKGIRDLCAAIEVPCVAEGIENENQHIIMSELGFQYGQGYYLCKPISPEKAEEMSFLASAKIIHPEVESLSQAIR